MHRAFILIAISAIWFVVQSSFDLDSVRSSPSAMTCTFRRVLTASIYLIAFVVFSSGIISASGTAKQRLRVQVYYEALCPDSVRFVRRQLYYAMKDNGWMPSTQLELIPYGKASYYNSTTLFCQHGEQECELNAWHACIIENHESMEQLALIRCMLASEENIIDECGADLHVNVTADKNCRSTRTVADILRKYGEATDAIELSYVPSVAFDNHFDPYAQIRILNNFDAFYCRVYKQKYNTTLPNCS